jgi:hypothetical protein
VREIFILFFSNNEFISPLNKVYRNFAEYYMVDFLKDREIDISEIEPPPPDYFNSLYSPNKLQILEYPESSRRTFKFIHPVEKKIMFMPDSCKCNVNEELIWASPDHFYMIRKLNIVGLPMSDGFEPRVLYEVVKVDD